MSTTRARRRWDPIAVTRRGAWALALALWLPLAQTLAWAHTFAHHSAQRADASVLAGQFDASCATCLGAAPLHGGALPTAGPVLADPPFVQAAPLALACAERHGGLALAYHSRAPPPSLI